MTQLKGKTALVTGGSRGIGASIAKTLAEHGADVAITYSNSAAAADDVVKAIADFGVTGRAYKADANKPETMQDLATSVKNDFGRIDILVNNAGVFLLDMIGDVDMDDFNTTMNVNVNSVFTLGNAVVPLMEDGGRIINIGSVLGERAIGASMSAYNTSKAAVALMSRSWAKDLGARDILVNVVQPGPIDTEMNPADGENADANKGATALGRYGKPQEIANAVAFLAGPDASYITGATLNVDGGMNA